MRIYKNQYALSIYSVDMPDSPVVLEETNNHRKLLLPKGASTFRVLENPDRGWVFRLSGGQKIPMEVIKDNLGMMISFNLLQSDTVLTMDNRPKIKRYGIIASAGSLTVLLIFWLGSVLRHYFVYSRNRR